MNVVVNIIQFLMIPFGFVTGSIIERRHLRSLDKREAALRHVQCSTTRRIPVNWRVRHAELVCGQVVIGSDYYKTFASTLRNVFGGEVRSVETLMVRARREATVRMLEEAAALNARAVWNVRLETSTIGRVGRTDAMAMAEVYAYGTALCLEDRP